MIMSDVGMYDLHYLKIITKQWDSHGSARSGTPCDTAWTRPCCSAADVLAMMLAAMLDPGFEDVLHRC